MTNRKRLSRVICAVLTLSMLLAATSCSVKPSSTTSTTSLSTEPITLNFWDMDLGTTKYNDEDAKLSAAYSKVAKNITVKYTVVPCTNRYENFSVAMKSKIASALADKLGQKFANLSKKELDELAASFDFDNCVIDEKRLAVIKKYGRLEAE